MTWEGRTFLRASSAPPDQTPVWVDITRFINDTMGWSLTTGRQSTLSRAEPARLSVTLLNADHRFTPGNVTSPYFPWWTQGCRLQLQESIGPWSSEYPDFYLELPEVAIDLPGVDQSVTVNATDRLGRLQSARTFISTLGAHILGSSPGSLVLYHPLNDAQLPFRPEVGAGEIAVRGFGQVAPYSIPTMVVPGDTSGPPGEDASFPTFTPTYFDPPTPTAGCSAYPFGTANVNIHVGSGDTIAISAWMNPKQLIAALSPDLQDSFFLAVTETAGAPASFGTESIVFFDPLGGSGSVIAHSGANFVTVGAGGPYPREVWRLVTARLSLPSGAVTLWIGSDRVASGTLAGAPSSYDFVFLHIGHLYFGSLAHLQVRVGVDAFPYAEHLAQFEVGMTGLERQSTGARVRTICGYAGVPAGEVDADDGIAVMQKARLAGKDPLTALREAEATEQGRLLCRGSSVVFQHRHHRYSDP